jgi:nitrogenase molybdenum-iron protein alpha/beta subunit/molybdenum cofactor biosynthesis enzyme MoaA/predicted Fe-Mo cluster-binding NifX family protein
MSTHYNEPVDIASSSLTEEGTVFGGEKNLVKGLENLIKLYDPAVIGVVSTCLSETIGEDLPAMVKRFRQTHPYLAAEIITVSSSGYSGTQYEGYFQALRALVQQVDMDRRPNGKINVIAPPISPADARALRNLLNKAELPFILLPDLSDNLDGEHKASYQRLPGGGTRLAEIKMMGGARLTIEMSSFVKEELSPARYLKDIYGVPFVRCPLPVGLRDTDNFLRLLRQAGAALPEEVLRERGRYLDAMIDSHKYNAAVRAAVYGEPDFVYAIGRLLAENGALPVVAATGSRCPALKLLLLPELAALRRFRPEDAGTVLDGADFTDIEEAALHFKANVLIGNSDGRRIEERHHIPLVRASFPVHDQIGGQRVRSLGYDGSIVLLDRITNAVLGGVEKSFRKQLYREHYQNGKASEPARGGADANRQKSASHPCFNGQGGPYARIHLPVAPDCNIKCNYCLRKYDCVNESRPGVTAELLSSRQALDRYILWRNKIDNLSVAGIAGPGDALANFPAVRETFSLLRAYDEDITFCLSTNGLFLPVYADELASLGVSHVTVTVNSVDPSVGAKIYEYVDYLGKRYKGEAAAALIMGNQLAGLKRLAALGIVTKVNIVMLKGINDHHIKEVAQTVKEAGCLLTNIMQVIPVPGSAFAGLPLVTRRELDEVRKSCEEILPQMYHCRQCRADAVGRLDFDEALLCRGPSAPRTAGRADSGQNLTFAVSSKSGVLVDQHFGQATDFYVYEYKNGGLRFKERRGIGGVAYCGQRGEEKEGKMDRILTAIADCDYVLTMRIGEAPRGQLDARGVKVHTTYSRIEDAVWEALDKRTMSKL